MSSTLSSLLHDRRKDITNIIKESYNIIKYLRNNYKKLLNNYGITYCLKKCTNKEEFFLQIKFYPSVQQNIPRKKIYDNQDKKKKILDTIDDFIKTTNIENQDIILFQKEMEYLYFSYDFQENKQIIEKLKTLPRKYLSSEKNDSFWKKVGNYIENFAYTPFWQQNLVELFKSNNKFYFLSDDEIIQDNNVSDEKIQLQKEKIYHLYLIETTNDNYVETIENGVKIFLAKYKEKLYEYEVKKLISILESKNINYRIFKNLKKKVYRKEDFLNDYKNFLNYLNDKVASKYNITVKEYHDNTEPIYGKWISCKKRDFCEMNSPSVSDWIYYFERVIWYSSNLLLAAWNPMSNRSLNFLALMSTSSLYDYGKKEFIVYVIFHRNFDKFHEIEKPIKKEGERYYFDYDLLEKNIQEINNYVDLLFEKKIYQLKPIEISKSDRFATIKVLKSFNEIIDIKSILEVILGTYDYVSPAYKNRMNKYIESLKKNRKNDIKLQKRNRQKQIFPKFNDMLYSLENITDIILPEIYKSQYIYRNDLQYINKLLQTKTINEENFINNIRENLWTVKTTDKTDDYNYIIFSIDLRNEIRYPRNKQLLQNFKSTS